MVNSTGIRSAAQEPVEARWGEWNTSLHGLFLLLSLGVICLAFLLRVRGNEEVVVPWVEWPLPGSCTYKVWLGVDCPGCGMTRCFISVAHGQVQRAWRFNPVGILAFALIAAQVPYRALQIWRIRSGRRSWDGNRFGVCVLLFLAFLLVVQWAVRIGPTLFA